ncbi:conserved hypothetical protein [Desulfofarcimen acetoxidans DSM 771]|uniref:DUF2269 domain-containing protein n=1 Tax=Desulfofarcimen acetoxidans (strain ATCC 49208 / DSM 771 / KCTC 5769 / VKM B-1644 / 5575) TaxID=485916 RepID=C8W1J4_DESAS|nr:hypothetical protein [Desulfofarcimen acetoxidans]ACV61639.1 conserved hypothetical protein [Desulfofarcimen acetoxidans DSM 771]
MPKLGIKGRQWLKGLHIFFCCTWVGTGLSMVLLGLMKTHVVNGDELFAFNASIKLLDDYIVIPSAFGCLITGLLICWLTNWGFIKFNWVIVKWAATVAQILFGTFFLGPWVNGATAIADADRIHALQNTAYLYDRHMNNIWGSIQVAFLVVLVFISVFKPWGKREATAAKK